MPSEETENLLSLIKSHGAQFIIRRSMTHPFDDPSSNHQYTSSISHLSLSFVILCFYGTGDLVVLLDEVINMR